MIVILITLIAFLILCVWGIFKSIKKMKWMSEYASMLAICIVGAVIMAIMIAFAVVIITRGV